MRKWVGAAAALVALLLLGAVVLVVSTPPASGPDTPLPWDMAYHTLRSIGVAEALEEVDVSSLIGELRVRSVYPAGFYLAKGVWIWAFGTGIFTAGLYSFFSLSLALTGLWLVFREDYRGQGGMLIAGGVLLATIPYIALLHTVMLDAHAVSLAILTLGLLSRRGRLSLSWLAACFFALTATLLTKYSTGLPLLASVGALAFAAWLNGERARFMQLVIILLGCIAMWALYLTWQDQGWEKFVSFAKNRSNTEDWSLFRRSVWYLRSYDNHFMPASFLSIPLVILAAFGARKWREPAWIAAAVYVAGSFVAIANHPYVIPRNLLIPATTFPILAGMGFATITGRTGRSISYGLAGALTLSVVTLSLIRHDRYDNYIDQILPLQRVELIDTSHSVENALRHSKSALLLGGFMHFSEPWTEILWARSHSLSSMGEFQTGLDYPGTKGRTGVDASPSPEYQRLLRKYLLERTPHHIIAIEVDRGSPWVDEHFKLWNEWKQNYVSAAAKSPLLIPMRSTRSYSVTVHHYKLVPAPAE